MSTWQKHEIRALIKEELCKAGLVKAEELAQRKVVKPVETLGEYDYPQSFEKPVSTWKTPDDGTAWKDVDADHPPYAPGFKKPKAPAPYKAKGK